MRNIKELKSNLGHIDVYLLDYLLKNSLSHDQKILDAGCGHGRNLQLLLGMGYQAWGIDIDSSKIEFCKSEFPNSQKNFLEGDLEDMPFENHSFDLVISSAVLHFAKSTTHFESLFAEHIRILKTGGTFFIRMATAFGMQKEQLIMRGDGRFLLPDETERFLLTYSLLYEMMDKYNVALHSPVKTVNVHEQRAMGVIVLKKN